MTNRPKILILTSQTGGGHISLAEALRDRLAHDYMIELNDPQPHFFHWHYRLVSRYALWLWAAEFRFSNTPQKALFAHRLFTRLVAKELKSLLERLQPTMVITTYPFLSYEVMEILEKTCLHIPLVMLLSDPNSVHAAWLTERRAAAILAPTRETYAQALSVGIHPDRLHLVGWPLRRQFSCVDQSQRSHTLNKLGLIPTRFTVFLQGGGEGAAKFGRTVEHVLEISQNLQIILATGSNQILLNRFKTVKNLHALPFTKEIAPLMAASDVVMGKAGPNMLFESVALGKPFIATAYIPGQEKENLAFIRLHQLGWVALEPDQQRSLLTRLTSTNTELQAMTATVETYRQWNMTANEAIVPIIHHLLN